MTVKICSKCNEKKKLSEFYKSKTHKDGFQYWCKICGRANVDRYHKTFGGVLTEIYNGQKQNVKKSNFKILSYSKVDLGVWLRNQVNFEQLWNDWIESGYDKMGKPSVDRINCLKGYSFDNIQLMTWRENQEKSYHEAKHVMTKRNNKSGSRGVKLVKGRWHAVITVDKKIYFLGSYIEKNHALGSRKNAEALSLESKEKFIEFAQKWVRTPSSGHAYIYCDKNNVSLYSIRIRINKKKAYFGSFKTLPEALVIRNEKLTGLGRVIPD